MVYIHVYIHIFLFYIHTWTDGVWGGGSMYLLILHMYGLWRFGCGACRMGFASIHTVLRRRYRGSGWAGATAGMEAVMGWRGDGSGEGRGRGGVRRGGEGLRMYIGSVVWG